MQGFLGTKLRVGKVSRERKKQQQQKKKKNKKKKQKTNKQKNKKTPKKQTGFSTNQPQTLVVFLLTVPKRFLCSSSSVFLRQWFQLWRLFCHDLFIISPFWIPRKDLGHEACFVTEVFPRDLSIESQQSLTNTIGVAFITHITHARNLRRKNNIICNIVSDMN